MNEQLFHEIVSGRRRGLLGTLARMVLWWGKWPYGAVVGGRNWRFSHVSDAVTRVEVPVVSVGNVTVGGAGKTPMVKWIAGRLRERGVRVAILSRGYGAEQGAKNDEALELEQSLPDVPHLQDPDRVASAQVAMEELESQALLLDDGFQHRRLGRDLDMVLVDATNPFGYGHLLPRGLLREPIASLRRADVVCLTRADLVDEQQRAAIRKTVERHAPNATWCEASHRPQRLVNATGDQSPLSLLEGKRVAAFCGIGNPEAFRMTLGQLGCEPVAWRAFPDHHNYGRDDLQELAKITEAADLIVCTHKDLAKIQADDLAGKPLWAVQIEMQLLVGGELLGEKVDSVAQRAISRAG